MAISEKLRKKLEKRKAELAKGSGEYKTIILKSGTTRLRLLPVGPDEDFAQEVTQFFINGSSVVSPATFGEPCAIMEMYNELKSSDNESDQELAAEFKPTRRYYAPAIAYTDDKGTEIDGSPKLVILPASVYNSLIDLMLDDENGDFTDPKEGYDIKIKKEGQGKQGTTYSVLACKPTKLAKQYAKEIFDPEEMTRALVLSYDETKAAINSHLNLSDDDEDEAPKKKKKKPTSDIDEAPKKKKKKKTSDDEAPKKKKKKK